MNIIDMSMIDMSIFKGKGFMKIALYTCAIIVILSGIALAADRDVIIGYHKPVGASENENVQSHGGTVKKDFHLIDAISASVPEDKIEEMKKDSRVKYVVNDTIYRITDEYSSSWGVRYIGSQPVHNQNINGTGVKIAVLDTGIDFTHPDLTGSYKGGYDFVNNDPVPWDDNCHEGGFGNVCHGTHVSGTIAAEHNGFGVVGVAPGASIYAVKVLDGGGGGSASSIISGIEWANNSGMNIISMSFGKDENNTAMLDAVNAAYNSGILLVASGGNTYGGSVVYPAAYDSVIAVTAIDQNGQKADLSPKGQKIEVAAPGVNINSTICITANAFATSCLQEGYGLLSGTSMAAPHVSGEAALIFSTNFPDVNGDGHRDNKDVRQIIDNTAFDTGVPGRDDIYGYGIVDVSKALLGISTYDNADLSITKDDGISEIIAGDGKTYTYTIVVKNNGFLDASNVKISDIWPVGFTRGEINVSPGSCDTTTSPTNFACDLGDIAKDGTATVTVKYTVPPNTAGNYTNRVEVSSTILDNNLDNNVAEDKNIVDIRLNLLVSENPKNNAKNVSLSQGKYSVNITNKNLSVIKMLVYENGILRKDLSSTFNFTGPGVKNLEMNVQNKLKIEFIPYGKIKSTGFVTIRRSS